MNKIEHPIQSLASLVKASIIASILAAIILLTVVLPAEYGIDPTGIGKAMGLTVMANNAEQTVKPALSSCDERALLRQDTVKLIIPANSGLEYKFYLQKGEVLEYTWQTAGAVLYFDFHGEPQGDTTGYFKSYKEATANSDDGSKNVPFNGSHGWYWKNESGKPIEVSLKTKGNYQVLGQR